MVKSNSLIIQSASDIITNSSSEVFIVSYDPSEYLQGSNWEVEEITLERIASCNYIRGFVHDAIDVPPFMDDMWIDVNHPGRLLESDYEEFKGYDDTHGDLYNLFKEYVKENQDEFDKVIGHYLVMVSDHDFEHFESNCDVCHGGYALGRF